jgi:phytoene dehydrogenase-like protein
MSAGYDVAIVGGGHNGLVCAAYLAKAGRKVVVLERGKETGGAARTEDFAEGFRVSSGAHLLFHLHPKVIADLKLEEHGLKLVADDLATVALGREGEHVTLRGGTAEGVSAEDAAAYAELHARLLRFAAALRPMLSQVPPRLGEGMGLTDKVTLAKLGWGIRTLGRAEMREFLRIVLMNVADLAEERFESDLLKGALSFDAVLGTHLGPRSPTTVLTLLYRLAGEAAGQQGRIALPAGGMGSVTDALRQAAEAAGAEVRTGAAVASILVEEDRAVGVALDGGEAVTARTVVSNADPKSTFLCLLGPRHLDAGFVRRVHNLRSRGDAAKLHLALDGRPEFTGLNEAEMRGRLVIAPSIMEIEEAFNAAKYGEASQDPAMEIVVPSLGDPTLAPEAKHVLSAVAIYAPYALKAGWGKAREKLKKRLIDRIALYAPNIKEQILEAELLTPLDIEKRFGMTGGHWHHGELAVDQLLMNRPVPGAHQYATPLPGLYLCGAGAHPGGGVMGAAGMNAARQVIAREKR